MYNEDQIVYVDHYAKFHAKMNLLLSSFGMYSEVILDGDQIETVSDFLAHVFPFRNWWRFSYCLHERIYSDRKL